MMNKREIKVGSRESILAVVQSRMVMEHLEKNHPEIETQLVTMKTTGDKILDRTLDKVGGKGLFVKELDQALRDKRADITVHSLKDMPMEVPEDIPLVAFSKREDPRDVLVLPKGVDTLDLSKPIGSSSMRRALQLKKLYPQAEIQSIRGNVQTRLRKLDEGQYGAIVLAGAGLRRLGLDERISRIFEPDEIIPAAGQGIVVVQGRSDEDYSYLETFNCQESELLAAAERGYVTYLNGGCTSPIAAFGQLRGEELLLRALYYEEESGAWTTGQVSGIVKTKKEAKMLGENLAKALRDNDKCC